MGWNQGYWLYENMVVNVYDAGCLTPHLLRKLLAPYMDTDMDHGGSENLTTQDGLSADEVVVKVLAPDVWKQVESLDKTSDAYMDAIYNEWMVLMGKRRRKPPMP